MGEGAETERPEWEVVLKTELDDLGVRNFLDAAGYPLARFSYMNPLDAAEFKKFLEQLYG